MEKTEVFVFLASGLIGALVSTIINCYTANRRDKRALSIKMIDEFNKRSELLTHVYFFLKNPERYKKNDPNSRKNYNDIFLLCMWLSVFSYLYIEKEVDTKIINNTGINKELIRFSEKITRAKFEPNRLENEWKYLKDMKDHDKIRAYF